MHLKPNEEAIELFKFRAQRYRFILFGTVAGLFFIYQNAVFGNGAVEIRPNFLLSIALLWIALFFAFVGFESSNGQVARFLKDRAQGLDSEYEISRSERLNSWAYRISHECFKFGIIGIFLEYTHFWLLQNTAWYESMKLFSIFGWGN